MAETNNPWHSISYGEDAPEVVRVIIEIPNESRAKYELDKETGMIKLDRVLFSSMRYPANYGFIPKTYCDDNDPLDALVLSSVDLYPNTLVDARVIGVMEMIDGGEQDDKIIAVANDDIEMVHINKLSDLPKHKLDYIRNFFEDYKKLEGKSVEVKGFHEKERAIEVVKESIELYNQTF